LDQGLLLLCLPSLLDPDERVDRRIRAHVFDLQKMRMVDCGEAALERSQTSRKSADDSGVIHMAGVFVSYRREDAAGEARALFNDLSGRLGGDSVFMDVDNITLGRDFRQAIQERLATCDLLLVIVGKGWVNAKNSSGRRRLEDPADFVRLEISAAMRRNIPVAPVLVQGAQMPNVDELPEDLKDFAYRNGFELSHSRWGSDVQEMFRRLGLRDEQRAGTNRKVEVQRVDGPAIPRSSRVNAPSAPVVTSQRASKRRLISAGAMAAAIAVSSGGFLYYRTVSEHRAVMERAQLEAEKAKAEAELAASRKALEDQKRAAETEGARREAESRRLAEEEAKRRADAQSAREAAEAAREAETRKAREAAEAAQAEAQKARAAAEAARRAAEAEKARLEAETSRKAGEDRARGATPATPGEDADRLVRKARELEWSGNYVEATKLLLAAAQQGSSEGQYLVAIRYEAGRGVPKDTTEAAAWYQRAIHGFQAPADRGDPRSQYYLGHMYLYGHGVPRNDPVAFGWFRRAADQGFPGGEYYMGYMYVNGRAVRADARQAARWLDKAAEHGNPPAQYLLARMFADGKGVPRNEERAVGWYQQAAKSGFPPAQSELRKRGVPW
jgi:TPR repeat protein